MIDGKKSRVPRPVVSVESNTAPPVDYVKGHTHAETVPLLNVNLDNYEHSANPVLSTGEKGQWDEAGTKQAAVIRLAADDWRLWYACTGKQRSIGSATSKDDVRWTKYWNNLTVRGNINARAASQVLRDGSGQFQVGNVMIANNIGGYSGADDNDGNFTTVADNVLIHAAAKRGPTIGGRGWGWSMKDVAGSQAIRDIFAFGPPTSDTKMLSARSGAGHGQVAHVTSQSHQFRNSFRRDWQQLATARSAGCRAAE